MQRQHLLVVHFTHSLCVTRFANGSVATNLTPHIAICDRHQLDIARTEYWWHELEGKCNVRIRIIYTIFYASLPSPFAGVRDMEKENLAVRGSRFVWAEIMYTQF